MATFEAQVEGLTSLSIDGSSAPTQTELTQFLTDGAKEIINILPPNLLDWCAAQQTFTSVMPGSEAETMNTGKILRVYRNDGDFDRVCRRIRADEKGYANDPDEMGYASFTDPVFYTENNKLNVLPQGGSCKYDEVQYPSVAYGDSAISVFPDEAEYLVSLYASMRALQNKMGSKSSDLPSDITFPSVPVAPSSPSYTTPDISSVTVTDTVIGAMPTIESTTIANLGTAPTYTSPTVTGNAGLTGMESGTIANSTDQIEFDTWWDTLADMIETNEDIEIANAQMEKISTYINAYSQEMTDSLNAFNKENTEYQAKVQEAIQQAQMNAQRIQQEAQFDKDRTIQQSQTSAQTRQTQSQIDSTEAQQEASLKLQKEQQEYQAKLSKYSNELQVYSADVNKSVQDFNTKLQKHSTDYQWLAGQYKQLSVEYQRGLQLIQGVNNARS